MDVTEDLLQVTAKSIVTNFMEGGDTLTSGVKKKASEMGLNRDQTARLIERTNSEAFLSVFPEKTEFSVADPNDVLNEKVASEGVKGKTYQEQISRDFEDIFGLTSEKTASVYVPSNEDLARATLKDRVFEAALEEQARVAKYASEQMIDDAEATAWSSFRDTVLFGTPVEDLERDLVLAYPEKRAFVEEVVSEFTDRLSKALADRHLLKRASDIDMDEVVLDTPIVLAFKGLMDLV